MARRIDKLSVTLGRILKAHGLEGRLCEYRILGRWEKTVGAVIARHAHPQSVQGKKLTVIVDSSAWMQQLSLLKPELVEKINENFGRAVITDIILKLGEITTTTATLETPPIRTSLSQEERSMIEDCLQVIRDSATRESIRRVMEKDIVNKKNETTR
jgi:hypothetical protein